MNKQSIAGVFVLSGLFLAVGCESSGNSNRNGVLRSGIPPRAMSVQEGSGQMVYSADQAGRIYLYNSSTDQVVERYEIRKGQRFAVDAGLGRATLDSNEVSVGKLKTGATYKIYFLPENGGQ